MTTVTEKPMIYGKFTQISDDVGIIVCGPDDLPPIALLEPLQPKGWALLDDGSKNPLDFKVDDSWAEVYVYVREGS